MAKNIAKSKRPEAERASEWYAIEILDCVATRRAHRTKFQSVDFFGADTVGKLADGSHVYIQVTAGQDSAVTARRRKLEIYPWHVTDTVLLLQLRSTDDPANSRRKLWFFRVHRFKDMQWSTDVEDVEVDRKWFKAWKDN